ncbi:MAG: prepilin-type N-terminal cleavage/methylation domain-containing protein [Xanthomonadaceae bacterium]|nr:prepilin-type N-terminal cleavage/methylation domain-containing protein [Xanthomonadaceae bacterium]
MKNQRLGFTLVELMIVVAIIGILAAIAVPNYQKYQAKARQSEVKLNLAAAHTALTAFTTENSSYTGCLSSIGVGVTVGARNFYTFGFEDNAVTTGTCNGTPCSVYAWSGAGVGAGSCTAGAGSSHFPAAVGVSGAAATTIASFTGVGNPITSSVSAAAFVLGAAGTISTSAGTVGPDRWTMDQNKTLVNVNAGL